METRSVYSAWRWRNVTRPIVLARAGYRCEAEEIPGERCEVTGEDLHVAHRERIEDVLARGGDPWDPDECLAFCPPHHVAFDRMGRELASAVA